MLSSTRQFQFGHGRLISQKIGRKVYVTMPQMKITWVLNYWNVSVAAEIAGFLGDNIGDIEDFLGDNIGDTEDLYVQLQLNEFSMWGV